MGLYLISNIISPASSYDLVTLDMLHEELGITSQQDDTVLARLITQVSAALSQYCDRVFQIEVMQDSFTLRLHPSSFGIHGPSKIRLSRFPIAYPTVASFTGNTNGTTAVSGLSSAAGLVKGTPIFGSGIPAGATISDFDPIALTLVLSIAATATAAGVSMTTGLQVIQQTSNNTIQTLILGTDYQIDAVSGELIRLNSNVGFATSWEMLPLSVTYAGGYLATPPDVQDAALRWITMRWKSRGRDPLLKSRTNPQMGTDVYWIGGPPSVNGIPTEIAGLLDGNYRVPELGQ